MTNEELIQAVKQSSNVSDVCRKLNIVAGGGNYKTIRNKITKLNIDISHFAHRRNNPNSLRQLSREKIEEVVKISKSYRQVCLALGLRNNGGVMTDVVNSIKQWKLDTQHFHGQGWLKGKTHNNFNPLKIKDEDLFIKKYLGGVTTLGIKKRLFKEGKAHKCEKCNNTTWNDLPIPLELDHINGDSRDNRRKNLAVLCPNCHAQTDTYRGKNLKQYK